MESLGGRGRIRTVAATCAIVFTLAPGWQLIHAAYGQSLSGMSPDVRYEVDFADRVREPVVPPPSKPKWVQK